MKLDDAIAKIKADENLTKKFIDDPAGTLGAMGVDTKSLKIEKVPGKGVKSGPSGEEVVGAHWCVTVGYIGCISVGS